jgi:hypothetical protein
LAVEIPDVPAVPDPPLTDNEIHGLVKVVVPDPPI